MQSLPTCTFNNILCRLVFAMFGSLLWCSLPGMDDALRTMRPLQIDSYAHLHCQHLFAGMPWLLSQR